MKELELKKLQVEYKRVNAAREEQELRILELLEQIERLKNAIKIQLDKEQELEAKINQVKN